LPHAGVTEARDAAPDEARACLTVSCSLSSLRRAQPWPASLRHGGNVAQLLRDTKDRAPRRAAPCRERLHVGPESSGQVLEKRSHRFQRFDQAEALQIEG
jgi:hypothetical protein